MVAVTGRLRLGAGRRKLQDLIPLDSGGRGDVGS